ncbi:MAG: hypothetical protein RMJ43_00975 [Chloroherpetonaceae bacterium]|nr:hypothetical protein [Chthonomonadaceae bacterium]MDW8206381.1 hypothetical protein [Chloroherpetonaceae bacterium]
MRNNPSVRFTRLMAMAALLSAVSSFTDRVRAQDEAKPADNTTYTWSFKYKKGEVLRFKEEGKLTLNAGGMELPAEVTTISRREVKNIAENGDVTMEDRLEESSFRFAGQEVPNPEPDRKTVIVINKAGIVTKLKTENSQQAGSPMEKVGMLASSTPIPEKPVRIGEEWKTELDNPLLEGKKVTVLSRLTGKEKINGVETLVVQMKAEVAPKADSGENEKIRLVTTYYVDPQAGRIVRVKSVTENVEVEVMGMTIRISAETVSNLLKEGEDGKKSVTKGDA